MSQAHRPTWNPTQGRETKAGSQQVSKLAAAAHTKLKFRQPGQTNQGDVQRRDLKAELAAAERAAQDKKRKAAGLAPLPAPAEVVLAIEADDDEERTKRRRLLEEAMAADKDDESESEEENEDEEDSDYDSDDDDAAALMAELAKIRQERAEEKARIDAEAASKTAATRDEEIATGNPLLNLQAALGQGGETPSSVASSGFTVKRRWDDDLIFKNQAVKEGGQAGKGEFVNDLLRSDFHRKFMHRQVFSILVDAEY